jgi:hypothetical protein
VCCSAKAMTSVESRGQLKHRRCGIGPMRSDNLNRIGQVERHEIEFCKKDQRERAAELDLRLPSGKQH